MLIYLYMSIYLYKMAQKSMYSVLDINLTLTFRIILNFGHPTSQPKFNKISTSYDVVFLLGIIGLSKATRIGEHLKGHFTHLHYLLKPSHIF